MPAPLPTILERSDGESTRSYWLEIDPSLSQFRGHFPGRPVLPGVAQVDWAAQLVKVWLEEEGEGEEREANSTVSFSHLSRIKFIRPVEPGVVLQLLLKKMSEGVYKFRFSANEQDYSSGRLHFDCNRET